MASNREAVLRVMRAISGIRCATLVAIITHMNVFFTAARVLHILMLLGVVCFNIGHVHSYSTVF